MSGTGIFKSSQEAAQNNSMAMIGVGAGLAASIQIGGGKTTLTFMNTMKDMAYKWSSCNAEFKDLLAHDSANMMNLQQYFDEFDAETASQMGGNS